MNDSKVPSCEFDSQAKCRVDILEGERRENCTICIIMQQQRLIKAACRVILANAITNDQSDAMEVVAFAMPTDQRLRQWLAKYRQDIIEQAERHDDEEGEPLVLGPDGVMTADEAIAEMIKLRKNKGMNIT